MSVCVPSTCASNKHTHLPNATMTNGRTCFTAQTTIHTRLLQGVKTDTGLSWVKYRGGAREGRRNKK